MPGLVNGSLFEVTWHDFFMNAVAALPHARACGDVSVSDAPTASFMNARRVLRTSPVIARAKPRMSLTCYRSTDTL